MSARRSAIGRIVVDTETFDMYGNQEVLIEITTPQPALVRANYNFAQLPRNPDLADDNQAASIARIGVGQIVQYMLCGNDILS